MHLLYTQQTQPGLQSYLAHALGVNTYSQPIPLAFVPFWNGGNETWLGGFSKNNLLPFSSSMSTRFSIPDATMDFQPVLPAYLSPKILPSLAFYGLARPASLVLLNYDWPFFHAQRQCDVIDLRQLAFCSVWGLQKAWLNKPSGKKGEGAWTTPRTHFLRCWKGTIQRFFVARISK